MLFIISILKQNNLPVSEELFRLLSYIGESGGLRYGADNALDFLDAKSGVMGTSVALVFLELSFTALLYDDPRETISFRLKITLKSFNNSFSHTYRFKCGPSFM